VYLVGRDCCRPNPSALFAAEVNLKKGLSVLPIELSTGNPFATPLPKL
jgi:hypothetical protein